MTLRGDSYGTVAEVTAYTRHLLDGQSAFNSTTRQISRITSYPGVTGAFGGKELIHTRQQERAIS